MIEEYIKKRRYARNLLDTIGNTPLVKLERLYPDSNINLFGKLESFNPGGSVKDRTAQQLILKAIEDGDLRAGDTIVESSSGNLAIGLAQACLFYGIDLIVVVDPLINPHTLKVLETYGTKIEKITEPSPSGGYLAARLDRVKSLLKQIPRSFWTNQYANKENPKTHETTMEEIVKAIDDELDYLFVATGTCGTIMGCAEYIKKNKLSTKIIAVDAVGSIIFGGKQGTRKIPGHGAARKSNFLDKELIHDVIHVTDEDCVNGCKKLLSREAILCGGSSGAVVSAIEKYLMNIPIQANCAAILCDNGERYLDTIYNQEWVDKNITASNTFYKKSA